MDDVVPPDAEPTLRKKAERLVARASDDATRAGVVARLAILRQRQIRSFDDLYRLLDKAESDDTRIAAATLVGELADPRAAASHLGALLATSQSPELRRTSVYVLAQLRAESTRPLLERAVASDADAEVRRLAAHGLSWLPPTQGSQTALTHALANEADADVRAEAAEALRYVGSGDVEPFLISALSDASPDVRFAAAYALASIGSTVAVPHLRPLAEADHEHAGGSGAVSAQAATAIEHILERERASQ